MHERDSAVQLCVQADRWGHAGIKPTVAGQRRLNTALDLKSMPIDTSGKWWKGSAPEDVGEYLQALSSSSYPASEFRLCRCQCGGVTFRLEVEQDEGVAKRACANCGAEHLICDSADNYEEGMKLRKFKCVCKTALANVGVSFSLHEGGQSIRWLWVGHRCVQCGVLGSIVEWKVGYEPSLHLLDQV
jgi:hypothetical protein